jgi:hypothetical protein
MKDKFAMKTIALTIGGIICLLIGLFLVGPLHGMGLPYDPASNYQAYQNGSAVGGLQSGKDLNLGAALLEVPFGSLFIAGSLLLFTSVSSKKTVLINSKRFLALWIGVIIALGVNLAFPYLLNLLGRATIRNPVTGTLFGLFYNNLALIAWVILFAYLASRWFQKRSH